MALGITHRPSRPLSALDWCTAPDGPWALGEYAPRQPELRVTDKGPSPGAEPTFPSVASPEPLRPSGNGLRVVEVPCSYWDWKQHSCGALTVRAVFPR